MKTLRALFGFTLICSAHCSLVYGQISSNGPALSAAMEGGSRVALSWPKSAAGFALEYRSDVSTNGNWTVSPESPGIEGDVAVVRLMATNAAGFYRLRFVGAPLPPDPSSVAPPLAPAIVTDIGSATSFLYSGTNAIQTGVTNGTIQAQCAAAIRGVVRQSDGQSLPGVTISILNHVEYGQTLSRADGRFDLAVNGGGALAVKYEKSGFLPAQRTVSVPWQDFVEAPEVGLIAVDSVVTPVTLGSNAPLQVARGSAQTDGDGTRQATVLLPAAVGAALVLPNGTTQTVASLNIRATEYTVGDQGPKAMPAQLPPTSAYTYCVELSADEAVAAGATTVEFDQPLPFYVENFLGMPVGIQVPTAYYDKTRGAWTPTDDGRVIQILSISNGLALLDVTGGGLAADAPALSALGITPAEQRKLAELYSAGASLWRVGMQHFSSYDCNYSVVPQAGAALPNNANPQGDSLTDSAKSNSQDGYGSLELENQIFRESVGIVGTSFSLHYASDRVPGRNATMRLDIPLSGTNVPGVLKRITLEVSVAGRTFTNNFPPQTNLVSTFVWDGHDVYGRTLNGAQPVLIRVGYVYNGYYALPPSMARTFGAASGELIPGDIPARREVISWQEQRMMLGHWVANGVGLGGWTLSVHHAYDPNGRMIYYGDGRQRNARNLNWTITTIAGTGISGFSGDGGPATQAQINSPCGVKVAPDGSVLIADSSNGRIRRIDPNGIIQTIAGGGSVGDNIPATQAKLDTPLDACAGPDGSVYVLENNGAVRRVRPDGIIVTIAPDPAELVGCGAVEVAPDGTVYVGDWIKNAVRRITADGTITTVAGTGVAGFSGDGGPAVKAQLNGPAGVALGPDGSLYIACIGDRHVRRVTPDGIITTVAGDGSATYRGDGGPATQAGIDDPTGVAIAPTGDMFISLGASRCVRRVTPDGIISTFAGNGVRTFDSDEGPATQASLMQPHNICVGPDGAVYFPDYMDHRVRKVTQPLPGFGEGDIVVPSEDGTELYHFDPNGRHLRTLLSLTGAIRYQFEYDTNGFFNHVIDGDGKITRVERDAAGLPRAIVAPFRQRTTLEVNSLGYLSAVTNPANETNRLTCTPEGLLTAITGPLGRTYSVSYDADGRAIGAADPAGGADELARNPLPNGHEIVQTTASGYVSRYRVEDLPIGAHRQMNVAPDGSIGQALTMPDGSVTNLLADGTLAVSTLGPDPRFGMLAPLIRSQIVKTPGGLISMTAAESTVTLSNAADALSLLSLTTQHATDGRVSTSVYTASNRTIVATSAAGRQSFTRVDASGRTIERRQPGLETVFCSYDSFGRPSTVTIGTNSATARTTSFGYDAAGYLYGVTNALGYVTLTSHDLAGRPTQQNLADGGMVAYAYDADGNLTSLTPPGRPPHAFAYTEVDLNSTYTPPPLNGVAAATVVSYNSDGQVMNRVDPDGRTCAHFYDAAGRLSLLKTAERQVQYTYDPTNGTLTHIDTGNGQSQSFVYDGSLLLEERWEGAVTGKVSRAYGDSFRVQSLTVNGQYNIPYEYDADSLITRAGELRFARDPQNGLLDSATNGSLVEIWSRNGFGEITNHTVIFNGTTLATFTYMYDLGGRVTNQIETVSGVTTARTFAYDPVGRITSVMSNGVAVASYTFDANGNRLLCSRPGENLAGTYDAQDRLLSYGAATYAYDATGELTNRAVGAQSTLQEYDALGNLTRVVLPNATVIEYVYDGTQRRVGRRANGALTQGFLFSDSTCPIAELDGTNQVVALFIYGSGSHVPDYFIKGGVSFQIVTDQIGSPRLVINCQTGEIIEELEFDEFGRVLLDTAPGFQPFGFAGGLRDPDSGLTRFGARDYDAETGRWTTKDPLRFTGGSLNQYSYAMNSPLNLIDSTGLGPPEKNQSQDPSKIVTTNPNATFHPTTADYKYVLGEIDRIDAQIALLSSKCGNVPNGRASSGDEYIVQSNLTLGVDITDPDKRLAYELGMGGSSSLLELEDPAYKIQRLQEEKQIYQDFLKNYTPTKRQQAQLPTSSVTLVQFLLGLY